MGTISQTRKIDSAQKASIANWLWTRSVFFYLCVIILSLPLVDYQKLVVGNRIRESAYFEPESFQNLFDFLDSPESSNPALLKEYVYYYESVIHHVGQRADAYGMLGIVQYYLGDSKKAVENLTRAIEMNPRVFWFYYNAGVIYYQLGDTRQAAEILTRGLLQNPKHALNMINSQSPVYGPMLALGDISSSVLSNYLRAGYRDGYRLLALTYYEMNDMGSLLKISEQAIEANVGALDVFNLYAGAASYRLGKYIQALSYFTKSIELNRTLQAAYECKALAQEALKEKEKFKKPGLPSVLEVYFLRKEDLKLRVY